MKNKKRLKGFTLIEMIIVVAIFGLIMAVVLSLLDPVRKVYNNTYNEADTQAISENMRRYIGDQIQYADRMWLYTNMSLGADDSTESDAIVNEINEFKKNYYFVAGEAEPEDHSAKVNTERIYPYSNFKNNIEIFVLHINNPAMDLSTVTSIPATSHPGTITLSRYKGVTSTSPEYVREWSSETDYYDDYAFDISLQTAVKDETTGDYQYLDLVDVLDGAVDPTNLAMGIKMYRRNRDKSNPANVLINDTMTNRTITFKLKNLFFKHSSSNSNEIIEFADVAGKKISNEERRRFEWFDSDASRAQAKTPASDFRTSKDIYYIFTKAPTIENVV